MIQKTKQKLKFKNKNKDFDANIYSLIKQMDTDSVIAE